MITLYCCGVNMVPDKKSVITDSRKELFIISYCCLECSKLIKLNLSYEYVLERALMERLF